MQNYQNLIFYENFFFYRNSSVLCRYQNHPMRRDLVWTEHLVRLLQEVFLPLCLFDDVDILPMSLICALPEISTVYCIIMCSYNKITIYHKKQYLYAIIKSRAKPCEQFSCPSNYNQICMHNYRKF